MDAQWTDKSDERAKRIKTERTKLDKIFRDLPEDTRKIADKLIGNAAFMAVTLEDLQEHIMLYGCTEQYQNGAHQYGNKKSTEVDVYNTMIKHYSMVTKQLLDMLPDSSKKTAVEVDIMPFLTTRPVIR